MKILIVAAMKNTGRMMSFVLEQAEATQALGVEIDYFAINGKGILGYLRARKELVKKINEFKPDLIHAHFGLSGALANLQRKVPVVTTYHNGEHLTSKGRLFSKIALLGSKYNIFVAQHIYDLLLPHPKNYTIMPCGINVEQFVPQDKETARRALGFETDKKYILFGGAFGNLRKNYPLLELAVQLLPNKEEVVCLEMKGLSREECVQRMCACDVFCLPTKSEGSPQALKEAMACNCPIVATDVADIRHLLGKLPGHYIVSNKNATTEKWGGDDTSARELASLLQKALEYAGRTEGRERIMQLGLDNKQIGEKLVQIYYRVKC